MANPTTNFGWVMPTSGDLVTDLPADFAVFGQGVDTTLADLKGGTTGQVLKKNSNTDMDFVWSADSAGMTNPMTTTGDTIYSSSGSTPARLGIGTTGQVLAVSGGVPAWTTLASGSPTMYEVRFTASTTWTVPAGVTKVWATICGGGGGGADSGSYLGEAGKQGEVNDQILTVTPGASVSVTIGAGGAGGVGGGGNNGDVGNASSFGSLSAAGGYFGAAAMWTLGGLARGKQAESAPINGGITNAVSSNATGIAGGANTSSGGGSSRTTSGTGYSGGAGGSGFIFIRYVI